MDPTRLRWRIEGLPAEGDHVLYWMQAAQRVRDNPALDHAVTRANALGLPLRVVFGLTADYPDANLRHYAFMLDGLAEVARSLAVMGVPLRCEEGEPWQVALAASRHAAEIVMDRGSMPVQRAWRDSLVAEASCPVAEVETELVVPVGLASEKVEWAARTLRPKIRRLLPRFLVAGEGPAPIRSLPGEAGGGLDLREGAALLERLPLDRSVPPVVGHPGGATEAERRLEAFVKTGLDRYGSERNDPAADFASGLSAHLHFGQISPVTVALRVKGARPEGHPGVEAFLEELVVRRHLAFNLCEYDEGAGDYDGLPSWCRKTLEAHRGDPRDAVYDLDAFETGGTHDPYWNAAMAEMRATGALPNAMRMYWGKKVLEWSESPRVAFEILSRLNDRWFLDGRDPNSRAGVAWVFGRHDRPWKERPVYGTVRCMTAGGLERKYDMKAYLERVRRLTGGAPWASMGADG